MDNQDRINPEKVKNQEEILDVVRERGQSGSSENELVFDPVTGEFVIVKSGDLNNDPDTVPITSVAEDGWA